MLNSSEKLKDKLLEFFEIQNNLDILQSVLQKKAKYSLRIIEWFVTNYCKKNLVVYNVNSKPFNVYKKYKDNLKSYTKEKFDPFKRNKQNSSLSHKIKLKNKKTNEIIETSICQMNFFKWMITNNVHKYIEKHIVVIKKDMNDINNNKKKVTNETSIVNVKEPETKQQNKIKQQSNVKPSITVKTKVKPKINNIKKKLIKSFD